jgi:preprotein translocase SecE subunit
MTITPEKREPGTVESPPLPQALPEGQAPRGPFASYKQNQGRHVRMAAFWSVVFFLAFGCRFLHGLMIQSSSLRAPLGGIRIPVVGVDLSPSFLVSSLLFLAGLFLVYRWQQRPKVADLLIDTEAELKRVSWPKGEEVWNASVVVILSVLVLGALLAVADIFLFRVMRAMILGGS